MVSWNPPRNSKPTSRTYETPGRTSSASRPRLGSRTLHHRSPHGLIGDVCLGRPRSRNVDRFHVHSWGRDDRVSRDHHVRGALVWWPTGKLGYPRFRRVRPVPHSRWHSGRWARIRRSPRQEQKGWLSSSALDFITRLPVWTKVCQGGATYRSSATTTLIEWIPVASERLRLAGRSARSVQERKDWPPSGFARIHFMAGTIRSTHAAL